MHVALGADHAGFQLKDALKEALDDLGATYQDFGTNGPDPVDYPDVAGAVAAGVGAGQFDRGILVCGSGVGMAIAANKTSGVRAAPIANPDSARLAREHNDLNVLALGARSTPLADARDIVRVFLQTPFAGGRHERRVQKIRQLESSSH